jgi:formate hydrogenlyase subunit 6/NADH:ubiquinone oxidoreductase subunit I
MCASSTATKPRRKKTEPELTAREQRFGKKESRKYLGIRGYVLRPMWYTFKHAIRSTFGKQPDVFFEDKRGSNTVLYPDHRLILPDCYRGKNEVVWELCIGCELCARVCPNKCIDMEIIGEDRLLDIEEKYWGPTRSTVDEKKGRILRPGVNFGRCMFCGNCEEYCPTGAMRMTDYYELADINPEGLVYDSESLRVEGFEASEEDKLKLENKIMELPLLEPDKCTGCQLCMRNCPTRCIEMVDGPKLRKDKPIKNPKVEKSQCVGCGTCMSNCKFDALKMEMEEVD